MGAPASWDIGGPDTMQLEAVLASGLHDGLHEDEIEDLRSRGVALPAAMHVGGPLKSAMTPVEQHAAPRQIDFDDAQSWFSQNYPKLKPADLASFYREKYLQIDAPVRTGSIGDFDKYRQLLADRVRNANLADDVALLDLEAIVEPTAQQALQIAPEVIARHRSAQSAPRDSTFLRTSIIAILTCFSLLLGGGVGLGLANGDGVLDMFNTQNALVRIQSLLPVTLRN